MNMGWLFIALCAEYSFQVALDRATVSPQKHTFVVQGNGSDKIFLVYQPLFHKANGRSQLILSVTIANSDLEAYQDARKSRPDATFICRTAKDTTLEHIIQSDQLQVKIESNQIFRTGVIELVSLILSSVDHLCLHGLGILRASQWMPLLLISKSSSAAPSSPAGEIFNTRRPICHSMCMVLQRSST